MISCAYLSSNVATALSEHADIPNRQVVIIDAGHGGEDGGAVSCTGIPESKTNLEIAIKLQYILQLLGIKTIMIRTEDISVYTSGNTIASRKISDLKQRVNIVNNHPGCTLISIHQNYFSDSKYDGAQVFYNQNTLSRQLALLMQSALVQNLNKSSNRNAKMAEGIYLMENIRK
jgi:N-acetylmuramoyl-L-alanine amidase